MIEAVHQIETLKKEFGRRKKCLNSSEYEYRNMLTVASLIVESALMRKESRGAHARLDYNNTEEVAKHSNITKQEEKELCYVG